MIKTILLPIALQLLASAVIIAEFLIPSAGLLALLSIGLFVASFIYLFSTAQNDIGYLFIAADIVLIPVLIALGMKLLAKSRITLRKTLSTKDGYSSQSPILQSFVGKSGKALTNLRPAGRALVSGKRLDVVSDGNFISKNDEVVVVQVDGNRVVVRKADDGFTADD